PQWHARAAEPGRRVPPASPGTVTENVTVSDEPGSASRGIGAASVTSPPSLASASAADDRTATTATIVLRARRRLTVRGEPMTVLRSCEATNAPLTPGGA